MLASKTRDDTAKSTFAMSSLVQSYSLSLVFSSDDLFACAAARAAFN